MITSNQIIKLSEDWFKSVRGYKNESVSIFVNPDSSDLKELAMSVKESRFNNLIRFVADAKNQKVYVADGGLLIHGNITSGMGYPTRVAAEKLSNMCFGYGTLSNGKITFINRDNDEFKFASRFRSLTVASKFISLSKKSNQVTKMIDVYFKDLLQSYNWINNFFTYNWSFVDRYLSGFSSYINQEKLKFESWKQSNLELVPK